MIKILQSREWKKVEKADFVIENNGDLKELGSKVNQFVAQTRKEIRRGA